MDPYFSQSKYQNPYNGRKTSRDLVSNYLSNSLYPYFSSLAAHGPHSCLLPFGGLYFSCFFWNSLPSSAWWAPSYLQVFTLISPLNLTTLPSPSHPSKDSQISIILLYFSFFPCICYLLDAILFFPKYFLCLLFIIYLSLSLLPLVLCLFCSLIYSKHILQCLEHSKCPICLLNEIK